MPDEPAPTYTTERLEGMTLWTCIIPDASSDSGICGHKARDEGLMYQHMCQRHAGVFIKAPDDAADEDTDGNVSPSTGESHASQPDSPSSPRTPASLEAPPEIQQAPPTQAPPEPMPLTPPMPPAEEEAPA